MRRPTTWILALLGVLASLGGGAAACTAVSLKSKAGLITGRNYDWDLEDAWVLVNRRGMRQQALLLGNNATPLAWTARYGSVTINQYGRGMPCSGMNEAGLSIDVLWLEESVYPKPSKAPAVNELQWVQYQLDRAATVAEALALAAQVRITPQGARVHYYLADKTGDRAVLEYVAGKAVISRPTANEPFCLANNTWQDADASCAKRPRQLFQPVEEVPTGSLDRYCTALHAARATRTDALDGETGVMALYNILRTVQVERTVWQLVYDPSRSRLYIKTKHAPTLKYLDLTTLDFSPAPSVSGFLIEQSIKGDAKAALVPYLPADNRAQVSLALKAFGNPALAKEGVIERISKGQMAGVKEN